MTSRCFSSPSFTSVDHITPDETIGLQRWRLVALLVEGAQHRLRERVADDDDGGHALALDRLPELVRVERAVRERDDRALHQQRRHRAEPHARCRASAGTPRATPAARSSWSPSASSSSIVRRRRAGTRDRRAEAGERDREDAVRVHDALRHPGGAAGVQHVDVLGLPLDARCGLVRREHVLPPERALDVRSPVVDLDDRTELRRPSRAPARPDRRGSCGSTRTSASELSSR